MGIGKGHRMGCESSKSGNGRFVHRHCGAWELFGSVSTWGADCYVHCLHLEELCYFLAADWARALSLFFSFSVVQLLCRAGGAVL
jgi:hypothetical protein